MEKKKKNCFYNIYEYDRIIKLIREDRLEQALVQIEQYLEKYPKDVCGFACYADICLRLGRFDEARYILDNIEIDKKTPIKSQQNITLMKIKLLSCEQKYQECYDLFLDNFDMFQERDWHSTSIFLFLKKKLGLLSKEIDYTGAGFLLEQITNYSEEKLINFLLENEVMHIDEKVTSFSKDFPIREVFSQISSLLPLDDKIYTSIISDEYVFKYVNCGTVDGKKVDYLKVTTFHDTKDIVSLRPYNNVANIKCFDLSPKDEEVVVKKLSQIEKFNKKYNKV